MALCLTKHYAMKAYGEVTVWSHMFLTSALDGGEVLVSHPEPYTPGETAPASP
jgi:hypothetical protein